MTRNFSRRITRHLAHHITRYLPKNGGHSRTGNPAQDFTKSSAPKILPKISAAIILSVSLAGCSLIESAKLPDFDPTNGKKVEWLNGGPRWSQNRREWYHNTTQGTVSLAIPYQWFMALEQPEWVMFGQPGLLSNSKYLSRMGFIRAEASSYNPDGLPVGLARMKDTVKPVPGVNFMIDPATGKVDALGLTCAACHTGQINYKGKAFGIDGGQANLNIISFNLKMLEAMIATKYVPFRFARFATRVLGENYSKAAYKELKHDFDVARIRFEALAIATLKTKGAESEGFARVDALNRIGNQVFGIDQLASMADIKFVRLNTNSTGAPVSFPYIWDTSWFEWVQYDASIMSVSIRNSGEAMGVSAMVNMVTPSNYWDSTVKVLNIHDMESMIGGLGTSFQNTKTPFKEKAFTGLWAPKWPEHILGNIDRANKARAGEALYAELCAGCHLPPVSPLTKATDPNQTTFWDEKYWVKNYKPTTEIFNDYRKRVGKPGTSQHAVTTNCPTKNALGTKPLVYPWRLLRLPIIPISVVGTDSAQAKVMTTRKVLTPTNMNIKFGSKTTQPKPGFDENLFALALGTVVQNVNDRWNKDHNIGSKEAAWLNGGRPNCLQATLAYKARPLNGVWATAPFLHNGSVPTLFELLSPKAERRDTFWVGSKEFDVERVGYVATKASGLFRFDTNKSGNLNSGHEFSGDGSSFGNGIIGRGLTPVERNQLIEFLKTQ